MDKPFDALVVDNFFSETELSDIWTEVSGWLENNYFESNPGTHGGPTEGAQTTKKKGFFPASKCCLYDLKTYNACTKIFQNATADFSEISFACRSVLDTDTNSLLISLYTNGGDYKKHHDDSITTALFWFCKEPKKFSGGDLILHDIDETIEFTHNRMVMIPGWAFHEVTPVTMDENEEDIYGRFCLTVFLFSSGGRGENNMA